MNRGERGLGSIDVRIVWSVFRDWRMCRGGIERGEGID